MRKQQVEIVLGRVELERAPTRKGKGKPMVYAVGGIVFRNCEASKNCPLVLHRAVKAMPAHLKKIEGWTITALVVEKHLGYSVPKMEIVLNG